MIVVKLTMMLPELHRPYCNDEYGACRFLQGLGCILFEEILEEKLIRREENPDWPLSRKVRCSTCIETCKKDSVR